MGAVSDQCSPHHPNHIFHLLQIGFFQWILDFGTQCRPRGGRRCLFINTVSFSRFSWILWLILVEMTVMSS